MSTLTSLKKLFQLIENKRFHYLHKKEALTIYNEFSKVKNAISKLDRKKADDYAIEVLGSKRFAPWLYVYTINAGVFKEGWIPDNYYREIVVPKVQGAHGQLSFSNMITNSFFETTLFPDQAYSANGKWISKDKKLLKHADLADVFFEQSDKIVFKKDNSLKGKGVYCFSKINFNSDEINELGNGVVQNFIHQHAFFKQFCASALTTLRITTVVNATNTIEVRASYIKFGRAGETHVNGKAQIAVAVDCNTGELAEFGHLSNWSSTNVHPDSKERFKNKIIPKYREAIELCKELHENVPYIGCIGWDVAIDEEEKIHIIEWNGFHNDIKYSEMTQGPCFLNLGWENLWKTH
ncbi:sugar-transfer associated ATP-grasp domain-containing protein [Maribacter hydrothermalis]|uniref:sugar-transfer associated ATP-grasp domain-containing protein n=1 Tax=Maribacter hydrothermalis TaxID=1836467 RepID=UPI0018D34B7E|nr:sugar-transfer associated ATP-grasp domain-containing protein [Maribacter hydrothermalis]